MVLTQVLNSNLELVSCAAPPSDGPLPGGVSAADLAALELGRSLRHWLDLQGAVNALIDSSVAADKTVMVRCWSLTRTLALLMVHSEITVLT